MDTFQKEVVVERAPEGGANTVLIVIVLLLIVAAGVWWFTSHKAGYNTEGTGYTQPSGVNVDVNLPGGDMGSGATTDTGASGATGGTSTGGGTTYP